MAECIELQGLKHKLLNAVNTILSAPMDFSGFQGAKDKFKCKFGDAFFHNIPYKFREKMF